jgi:diaminopimelate epimerase
VQAGGTLCLSKHHGSGNDFLVLISSRAQEHPDEEFPPENPSGDEVRALCDRHRGVGADGLIVGRPGSDGADVSMSLWNADGSYAEMSGNGIRCLVQAAVARGLVRDGVVIVDTGAGRRRVVYRDEGAGLGFAEVDMGGFSISEDLDLDDPPVSLAGPEAVTRACAVGVGNPHIVLLEGPQRPRLAGIGPLIEGAVPGGTNVELIRPAGGGDLDMEVWERGVGMTQACGTGAVAAAAAARSWGIGGSVVLVTTAGGTLRVTLDSGSAVLAGPTRVVADVNVEAGHLHGLVADRIEESAPAL